MSFLKEIVEESDKSGPQIMRDCGLYRQRWHYFLSQRPENTPAWLLYKVVTSSGLPIEQAWNIIERSLPEREA